MSNFTLGAQMALCENDNKVEMIFVTMVIVP